MKNLYNQLEQAAELRSKAEAIVSKQITYSSSDIGKLAPEEMWQIVHELQVYQLELQMQNEELRRAQTELDAARDRYFGLYDLAPVGYLTLSDKGVILESNLKAANLLCVERGTLVNRLLSRFIFPEDQDIFYLSSKRLFETGVQQVFELRMVRSDGTNFWARVEAIEAKEEEASVRRIVLSDITLQKEAEDVLRREKKNAEFDNKQKSQFLANVSHDLRSPIHLLMYFISTINTENMEEQESKIIEMIKRRGKGLKALVDELLNISRLKSGKFLIRSEVFDLKELIDCIVEGEKIVFREKNIDIISEYRGDIKLVKGDSVKVDQVMSNIVHNALKYTQKGEILILTECLPDKKSPDNCNVKFSVKDTGVGIPMDKIDALFEPFTRFHGVSEGVDPEGSGLGLYIVKTLLDLIGGNIKVTSQVGVGSTFTVELNLETAENKKS